MRAEAGESAEGLASRVGTTGEEGFVVGVVERVGVSVGISAENYQNQLNRMNLQLDSKQYLTAQCG
jgi:hypothetical protein